MAGSVKDNAANAISVDTSADEKGGGGIVGGIGGGLGGISFDPSNMAKLAGIAGAALAADKAKPKISNEVRPFTRESLEKINLRTSNLIRDYGFLPKRSPHLLDGAQLPPKFEPFPTELLGKPVEELDQYVYEKVGKYPPHPSSTATDAFFVCLNSDLISHGSTRRFGFKLMIIVLRLI
jgi:hypothetical protein